MQVDPDVAELLDDLPPPRLPEACTDAGWGTTPMRATGRRPVERSTTPAPRFEATCTKCGRPITQVTGAWLDHRHSDDCDRALVPPELERRLGRNHSIVNLEEMAARVRKHYPEWAAEDELLRARTTATTPTWCRSCKVIGVGHRHVCRHEGGHFGFHECDDDDCRHLWR